MSLINLKGTLNSLKKDLGGIAERIANQAINDVSNKLEQSLQSTLSKGLKSAGISGLAASEISNRLGDSLTHALSDEFFKTTTSVTERISASEIDKNSIPNNVKSSISQVVTRKNNPIKTGVDGDVTQFPPNLGTYYITFKFKKYERPSPLTRGTLKFEHAIVLPIPSVIGESFSMSIDASAKGMVGGVFDALQAGLSKKDQAMTTDEASGLATGLAYNALVTAAPDGLGAIVGQYTGAVPNPHISVAFSGVNVRKHSFTWTFNARNPQESATLRDLGYKLKSFALPTYSTVGTAVLDYPLLCQPEMYPWAKNPDTNLVRFKPCLIENVEINHTPIGGPAFFAGTHEPVFTTIKVDLIETEIFTADEYGRTPDDRVSDAISIFEKGMNTLTGTNMDYRKEGGEAIIAIQEAIGTSPSSTKPLKPSGKPTEKP